MQGRSSASEWGKGKCWVFLTRLARSTLTPALSLLKGEGGEVVCFGDGGAWLSWCLGEKGQGIAATMPYRAAFLCGVAGEGLVR